MMRSPSTVKALEDLGRITVLASPVHAVKNVVVVRQRPCEQIEGLDFRFVDAL